jgi:hypothetical protein
MFYPFRKAILFICTIFAFNACAVKKGCPATQANVGAERVLSGDPKAIKELKKGKKYKLNKF